jgi:uncharacterized protein with FMN-binding domain
VALAVGVSIVMMQARKCLTSIEAEHARLPEVNLSTVPDGVYHGQFGSIPVSVKLNVTVKDHAITAIVIKKQFCGQGYDAKAMIPAIVQAQRVKVDAVAGATMSSKCIMVAVARALQGAAK